MVEMWEGALLELLFAMGIQASSLPPFEAGEVAWAQKSGTGAIEGSALLRTRGGAIQTCAGMPVFLVPDSAYARARQLTFYGNASKGFVDAAGAIPKAPPAPPADYVTTARETTCDVDGKFFFGKLPPGTYFVTTRVIWSAVSRTWGGRYTPSPQGGFLMQAITVEANESARVVLTD